MPSLFAPISPAFGQTAATTAFQLQLFPVATKLPADSGDYYVTVQLQTARDGKPAFAPYDIDVSMISSDPSVLVGDGRVTLAEGESMANAKLATTSKGGEATITAQADGIKSAAVTINTLRLDSLEPTKLALSSAPSVLTSNPTVHGMLHIQLLNSLNLPSASAGEVVVNLSSSRPQVATVPSYVTISPGSDGTSVFITPQGEIGTTKITASAPGFPPAQFDVKTDGQIPTKLVVEFGPPKVPAAKGFKTMMTVQLRDASDNPVKANKPVEVTLRSSNTSVTRVLSTVTINPGESYVTVPLTSEGGAGEAEITASAGDLEAGIGKLETTTVSTGTSEYSIELYQVPSKLPPDNAQHKAVIIQFVDSGGKPFNAFNFMYDRIIISSSDSKIGTVSSPYEQQYLFAIGTFKTTYLTGTTTITASSDGVSSTQKDIQVSGAVPHSIKMTQIPPVIQATGAKSQPNVLVSFLDSSGKPVVNPTSHVVYLSSSNPSVASLPASMTIQPGTGYALIPVDTTTTPGTATLSASGTNLATGNLQVQTAGSTGTTSEVGLAVTTIPKIPANGVEYDAVLVHLQDLVGGNPVPAKSDIQVTLSSSSPSAGRVQPSVTIPEGSSYAVAKFATNSVEESNIRITASSPGFKSVEGTLSTTLQEATIAFTTRPPTQSEFDVQVPVEVRAMAGSYPLKGATVQIAGLYANPTFAVTNELGYADGVYVATRPGTNSIEAKIVTPGYKEAVAKAGISLAQKVNLVVKATSEGGRDIPAQFKVQQLTSAAKTYTTQTSFKDAKWGSYTVTALDTKNNSGEFKFVEWSDGQTQNPRIFDVIRDDTITAVYSAKYMLQVTSEYGSVWGTGYYSEGTTANIGVDTTYVSNGLIDKDFAGWSGDVLAQSSTSPVTMNGPKTIKAEWSDNYLKIIILVGGTGASGIFLYKKMIKPRKVKAEMAKTPDLDWYKT